jgi:signal peptidase II
MPQDGCYAPFLFGRVVDMLYFPLYEGFLPEWVPFWGSEYFIFFRPVFNIADSAITIGVTSILLFHRGFFKD